MVELNPQAPHIWTVNAVLNGRARHYTTYKNQGTLSIKSVVSGSCTYFTPKARYVLNPGDLLLLDHGQEYEMEIDGKEVTETLCVFLRPGFAEEIQHNLSNCDPEAQGRGHRFDLCERLESNQPALLQALANFRSNLNRDHSDALSTDDCFLEVVRQMLALSETARGQASNLNYASTAVRTEVFRRLNTARDFMIQNHGRSLNLQSIARESNLAPSHFHFLFRSAYGLSPHEFLTTVRVNKAIRLLKTKDMPLWQIAGQVGFQSEAHLCRLVAKRTGIRPSQHRSDS